MPCLRRAVAVVIHRMPVRVVSWCVVVFGIATVYLQHSKLHLLRLPLYTQHVHREALHMCENVHELRPDGVDASPLTHHENAIAEHLMRRGAKFHEVLGMSGSPVHNSGTASVTAIASHDVPDTVCVQTRTLLGQQPAPEAVWLVTYRPGSNAPRIDRKMEERTHLRVQKEVSSFPDVVHSVRLTTALRGWGPWQLALRVTTEHVLVLEPHAVPSRFLLSTALSLSTAALYHGTMPAVVGERGCAVLPAESLRAIAPSAVNTNDEFSHLCLPSSETTAGRARQVVDVDYLDGLALLRTSLAKLLFHTNLPADLTVPDVFLSLSDALHRLAGVRTVAVPPAYVDKTWPAPGRGAKPSARAVHRVLRSGMTPVAVCEDGHLCAQHILHGGPGRVPRTEHWLIIAHNDTALAELTQRLGPICGRKAPQVRCDVVATQAEPESAQNGSVGSSGHFVLQGRRFTFNDGWEAEGHSITVQAQARAISYLHETMKPNLVVAAVGSTALEKADPLHVALRASLQTSQTPHFSAALSTAAPSASSWPPLSSNQAHEAETSDSERSFPGDSQEDANNLHQPRARLPLLLPATILPVADWLGTLPPRALTNWHSPRIVLVVITWTRPRSLKRLMGSLQNADYYGDEVALKFVLDAGADAETRSFVHSFRWPHGEKSLHLRASRAGLAVTVVESWAPASSHEYACLLEDDIEVAPSFYAWLKYTLLMYRYGDQVDKSDRLIGVSLYTPRLVEVKRPRERIMLDVALDGRPFLQQLPCSWGALYFPEPWVQFKEYMRGRLRRPGERIRIPGSVVDGWKGSWKKYLIEIMYQRAWWMLYPNFANQTSFSTNHLEPGEHINKKGSLSHRPEDYTVPLLGRTFADQLPGRSLERKSTDMPRLDLFSKPTTAEQALHAGLKLEQALSVSGATSSPART